MESALYHLELAAACGVAAAVVNMAEILLQLPHEILNSVIVQVGPSVAHLLVRLVDRSLVRSLVRGLVWSASVPRLHGRSFGWSIGRLFERSSGWRGRFLGCMVARSLIDRLVARSFGRLLHRSVGRSFVRSCVRLVRRSVARSIGVSVGRSLGDRGQERRLRAVVGMGCHSLTNSNYTGVGRSTGYSERSPQLRHRENIQPDCTLKDKIYIYLCGDKYSYSWNG